MISQRMCVVCRKLYGKEELYRVVKCDGVAKPDLDFKIQGRGGYICKNAECIEKARKTRAFERSLSMRVDPEVYDSLEELIKSEQ